MEKSWRNFLTSPVLESWLSRAELPVTRKGGGGEAGPPAGSDPVPGVPLLRHSCCLKEILWGRWASPLQRGYYKSTCILELGLASHARARVKHSGNCPMPTRQWIHAAALVTAGWSIHGEDAWSRLSEQWEGAGLFGNMEPEVMTNKWSVH